jgi:hypothetical protein
MAGTPGSAARKRSIRMRSQSTTQIVDQAFVAIRASWDGIDA